MPEVVKLPSLAGGQEASWLALLELSPDLSDNWILVGGQMVFLHQVERGAQTVRPTDDIDLVVDLRVTPSALDSIHTLLLQAGFEQQTPGAEGTAHRYLRDAATIDVLAPDHMGGRASLTLGAGRTIEAPGTRQAFSRRSMVTVELGDTQGHVWRPTVVGALIGKAAAFTKIPSQDSKDREKHRQDCGSLAELLGAPDRQTADLTRNEKRLINSLLATNQMTPLASKSLELLIDHQPTV